MQQQQHEQQEMETTNIHLYIYIYNCMHATIIQNSSLCVTPTCKGNAKHSQRKEIDIQNGALVFTEHARMSQEVRIKG